jgi:hypothetical protein
MEVFSFVVLILLSLVGYSAGAISKAGKSVQLKPHIADLILICVIWAGAISSRIIFGLDKWLAILVWLILSGLIAVLAVWPRKLLEEKIQHSGELREPAKNILKRLWQRWVDFSNRMGSFQSRIVLSLFFFIVVSPFALGVRKLSDPLGIKYPSNKSHWGPMVRTENNLERFRRQY